MSITYRTKDTYQLPHPDIGRSGSLPRDRQSLLDMLPNYEIDLQEADVDLDTKQREFMEARNERDKAYNKRQMARANVNMIRKAIRETMWDIDDTPKEVTP